MRKFFTVGTIIIIIKYIFWLRFAIKYEARRSNSEEMHFPAFLIESNAGDVCLFCACGGFGGGGRGESLLATSSSRFLCFISQ